MSSCLQCETRKESTPHGFEYSTYNNKVVQAKLPNRASVSAGEKYFDKILSDTYFIRVAYSGIDNFLDKIYYGRAFCNDAEGDSFNAETGKKIARKRCQELFFRDFDAMIVKFLEELHIVECRIFNRLRKSGKLDVYQKARTVAQMYDDNVRMPGQKDFDSYF